MQVQALNAIEQSISAPRIKSYEILTSKGTTAQNISAYIWNKRLGAALFPLMQCLEITLRNAIHSAASSHYNTADWFEPLTKIVGNSLFAAYMKKNAHKVGIFYRNGVSTGSRKGKTIWTSHHENMVLQAKDKLTRKGKSPVADAVVAELMFGFWVGMFESNYSDIKSTKKLWPHLETIVFPNLEASQRRASVIHRALFDIKELRNRMAHHEPIWKHKTVTDGASAVKMLSQSIDMIINLIRGISKERADLLWESGIESMARGICSNETLNFYLSGKTVKSVSSKKLERNIKRYLAREKSLSTTLSVGNRGTIFIDLWTKC